MWFVDCVICKENVIGFDTSLLDNKRVCNTCYPESIQKRVKDKPVSEAQLFVGMSNLKALRLKHARLKQERAARAESERVVQFSQPEDGSGKRYVERRKTMPWATHSLWRFIHNAISHPLIGILPFKPFFKFHDWTSRRMHGV